MTRLLLLAALAGCTAPLEVGSGSAGLGGIDVYEKQFSWTEPEQCETFLHRRVYDEQARIVSYEAERTISYMIDEADALPLAIAVDGDDGQVTLRASETDLEVRGAGGALALRIADYATGAGHVIDRAPVVIDPATLSLLACTLPMRTELGYVPGFVRNIRDASPPGADGVTGSSSEITPVLQWDGKTSFVGAWVRQALCLQAAPDGGVEWSCGCFEVANPVVGVVRGHCT